MQRWQDQPLRDDPGSATPARLLLDALEPRVLLNVDTMAVQLAAMPNDTQDHDILVRMAEETVHTGARTQVVERVQVVDATGGALLAFGDLTNISALTIQGGAGNDRLRIDVDSFGRHTIPTVAFDGRDGINSLVIDHSAGGLDWRIDGSGAGSVDAGLTPWVTFSGVQSLTGGADTDRLHGPAADSVWRITAPGAGDIGITAFSGFERLIGAADNEDMFIVAGTGAIEDGVDGGDRGFDSLVLERRADAVIMAAIDGSSGSVSLDGDLVRYFGLEPVTTAGAITDLTLTLGDSNDVATLTSDTTAGRLKLTTTGGTAESQFFTAPTGTLTINLGGGINRLTITGVDSRFASGLVIVDGGGTDTINVNSSLATGGKAVSMTADSIRIGTAGDAVTIDTSRSGGASGAITLDATTIAIAKGSALITGNDTDTSAARGRSGIISLTAANSVTIADATAATGVLTTAGASIEIEADVIAIGTNARISTVARAGTSGDISFAAKTISLAAGSVLDASAPEGRTAGDVDLTVADTGYRDPQLPIVFANRAVGISLDRATVEGGEVRITATAADKGLVAEMPLLAMGFSGAIPGLLEQIPGYDSGATFSGMDMTVAQRGADARITLDSASIVGSGSVTIASATDVETLVLAVDIGTGLAGSLNAAASYGAASSVVETLIRGTTAIIAGADVTVSADAKVVVSSGSLAAAVDAATAKTATSVAITISRSDLTALAIVGEGSTITAAAGSVNVLANGVQTTATSAGTALRELSQDGASAALSFVTANVKSSLDGTVTAGNSIQVANGFNGGAGAVDLATDTITSPNHGLATGDSISYDA
ncbi:MAG: hypothetical protein JNK67_29785, partial [Alphaproteobacteria bacterium]|nr:hypothetical protein [Alphaproteobacteria bacterium]